MWVTKLLISPVKKGFFAQKRPNLAQNWHFWSIWARPCRFIQCPVGGSVGGCGARAVSRKTPIYFILLSTTCKLLTGGKEKQRQKNNEKFNESKFLKLWTVTEFAQMLTDFLQLSLPAILGEHLLLLQTERTLWNTSLQIFCRK